MKGHVAACPLHSHSRVGADVLFTTGGIFHTLSITGIRTFRAEIPHLDPNVICPKVKRVSYAAEIW